MDSSEVMEWLIAFAIAYILVEHGGEIIGGLGEAFGSLLKFIGFLLL